MITSVNSIPPAISLEFNNLKVSSAIRKHPQGLYLFLAIWSGYYNGQPFKIPDIARELGIKPPSVWGIKSRVDKKLNIDWTKYDLSGISSHFKDLKDVSKEIPKGIPDILVEGKDGTLEIVPGPNESPTKYIARKHKNIMNDGLDLLDAIYNDREGRFIPSKVTNDHNGRKTEEVWFPGAYHSKEWMSLWDKVAGTMRQYARDWLEMFGSLEESVIMDELNNRKSITEQSIDFLQENAPQLVPKYIRSLSVAG